MNKKESRWLWLSHPLEKDTPAYGNGAGFELEVLRSMANGDRCNETRLGLPAHLGSHVDAPFHFVQQGLRIDSYTPDDWIFLHPLLLDIEVGAGELITEAHLPPSSENEVLTDILFFRTGFEGRRKSSEYWQNNPGIAPELSGPLKERYPALTAVGMDFISISSYQHRDKGKLAHLAFLGSGIRLFEDLSLANLQDAHSLKQVIALPLRISGGDGAPVTVIGNIVER